MIEMRDRLVCRSGVLLRYPPERAELEDLIAAQGDERLFRIEPLVVQGGPQACYFRMDVSIEESIYTHSGTEERLTVSGPARVSSGGGSEYIARQGSQSLCEIAAALGNRPPSQCRIAVESGSEIDLLDADLAVLRHLQDRGVASAFLIEPVVRKNTNRRARFFRFELDTLGTRRMTGPHVQSDGTVEEFINTDGSVPASALLRRLDAAETG